MSLKVLLADDSAAIKKVVQLSLQDFGIELKSVGSGKDVLDVAKSFVPDIVLVDVLLPHKTGYEIASELKRDPQLHKTPVVILWSSFMALDEQKFKASGADDKLEKPFEVGSLRALIHKYIPKTQANPLAKHLEFPRLEFDLASGNVSKSVPQPGAGGLPPLPAALQGFLQGAPQKSEAAATTPAAGPGPGPTSVPTPASAPVSAPIPAATDVPSSAAGGTGNWNMSTFQDISEFAAEEPPEDNYKAPQYFTTTPKAEPGQSSWGQDNEWVRKDLGKFKVPIPDENEPESSIAFNYPGGEIKDTNFLLKPKAATPDAASTHVSPPEASAPAAPDFHFNPIPNEPPLAPQGEPKAEEKPHIPNPMQPAMSASANMSGMQTNPSINTLQMTEALAAEIRAQAKEVLEKMVWKVVPEIATNLIKQELQRLLSEEK